jgi:hypothetical protein
MLRGFGATGYNEVELGSLLLDGRCWQSAGSFAEERLLEPTTCAPYSQRV